MGVLIRVLCPRHLQRNRDPGQRQRPRQRLERDLYHMYYVSLFVGLEELVTRTHCTIMCLLCFIAY